MNTPLSEIEVGSKAFLEEGGEAFGAIREVTPEGREEIVVYIENADDFLIPAHAIRTSHDQKVILDPAQLDQRLLDAIAHAHDSEVSGL